MPSTMQRKKPQVKPSASKSPPPSTNLPKQGAAVDTTGLGREMKNEKLHREQGWITEEPQ